MDQLRAHLRLGPPTSSDDPDIRTLAQADVRTLRLSWLSRFNPTTLSRHLANHPDMALWVPQTGEYIVSEPWRNREEIASICEVTARRGKAQLVRSLTENLRSNGYSLALLNIEAWRDQSKFYMDLGFEKIETIVFFELSFKGTVGNRARGEGVGARGEEIGARHASPLQGTPYSPTLFSRANLSDLDLLLEIDHDSFPWLWWNSRTEFEYYLQMPGVYAYIAYHEGGPVGYASFTVYQGWGHLDRLAVVTKRQGRKFGAAQLAHALQLISEKGASAVALSTQATNVQSHNLYRGFGFHQTSETMSFFGLRLKIED